MSIVQNILAKSINRVGLYTKRQCVDVASKIGKDLVDVSRNGDGINKDVIRNIIAKRAPKADIENIATNKDEFHSAMIKKGYSKEQSDMFFKDIENSGFGAFYSGYIKGIYVPLEVMDKPEQMNTVAHEMEHFLYNNNTVEQKFAKWLGGKILKLQNKLAQAEKKTDMKSISIAEDVFSKIHVPEQNISQEAPLMTSMENVGDKIQFDLLERFGLNNDSIRIFEDLEPDSRGVKKYLCSGYFSGLHTNKRVSAYIRAILRNSIHPKNKDSVEELAAISKYLEDESRAYKVSDNVIRYASGKKGLTDAGIVSYIYKLASKMLDRESKLAVKYYTKNYDNPNPKHWVTGLPTSALVKEG